jgi:Uma2 family endonuclease
MAMSISFEPLPGTVADPLYPESDEEAVGETDYHMEALILLREGLDDFFRRTKDVYVASDMFWYWQRGNPRACRAPDVLVAQGVGKHKRLSFRSWEEKATPCVLFEITSKRTVEEDLGEKKVLYARLKVPEYIVFDPEGAYLDPPLLGFRLAKRKYQPITPEADGGIVSQELGLRLVPEGTLLRLINIRTGRRVLTLVERTERAERQARQAKCKAQEERKRLAALKAEVARLQAELGQLNGEQ